MLHEIIRLMMRDHVDGRATETSARQARSETGGVLSSKLNEQIQFFGAVF
jgi:hypothetical protein